MTAAPADKPNPHPKALLLGIDTPIGLSIIRELGRQGVEVHGIAHHPNAIGLRSRYLTKGYIRGPSDADLIAQLSELGELHTGSLLLAISETDIDLLNRHQDALKSLKLLVPSADKMAIVTNKHLCQSYASRVGLSVPETYQITRLQELSALGGKLQYPLVLKWPNPNQAAQLLSPLGLSVEKSHYCHGEEELHRYMAQFQEAEYFPLIQSFCPGYGLGQFVFLHNGEPIRKFQHRRLREWPPEGGFSSACEVVPLSEHEDLMQKSVALLRSLNWEGAAMIEYRFDPASRRATFLEINGRFWGSLPLAYHAGAAFAWLTYCVLGKGEIPKLEEPASKLRCRFMIPETKHLARILFNQDAIQDKTLRPSKIAATVNYLLDFIRPNSRYFIFDWKDLKPFVADTWQVLTKIMKRLFNAN